jgi:dihydroorotase
MTIVPGLTDIHTHFREPGNEAAETILSGSMSAARGGFTRVVTMPNTNPPADSPVSIKRIIDEARRTRLLHILPAACITKNRAGMELSDFSALVSAGAIAFSDDGSTVENPELMKEAMAMAEKMCVPILDHALSANLAGNGVIRHGELSARARLPGIVPEAETEIVARDIDLSGKTGCRIHIQHLSTAASVELIRNAKRKIKTISAEATPHHIALTVDDIDPGNGLFKVNPPLGSAHDRESLINGLVDGTIDALATDHAPHTCTSKSGGFIKAPFGVIGLETAVGVTYTILVKTAKMNEIEWLRKWTTGPCKIIGINPPSLAPGSPADITMLDLDTPWKVDASSFLSKSRNTPFEGKTLVGRALLTMLGGRTTWSGIS